MRGAPTVLRALLPMVFDGVGPSATCVNLMSGMTAAGLLCRLYLDHARQPVRGVAHATALPPLLRRMPYRLVRSFASRRSERRFLEEIGGGDVAYLWPTATLEAHRRVHREGVPIVLEGINTRMGSAKQILDAAYEELGLSPAHGITQRRIDEEDEKLALAECIFCPSPGTEAAIEDHLRSRSKIVAASYGVGFDPARATPDRSRRSGPVRVVFIGSICVRKGAHKLLEAWRAAQIDGQLVLVGALEEGIRRRCAPLLADGRVTLAGFDRNVARHYDAADIFVLPSFEEGDPLVTYEAAVHGLPLVVSPMGGGRFASDHPEAADLVDPFNVDALAQRLAILADDRDRRLVMGAAARRAVGDYSWPLVAARRVAALRRALPNALSPAELR